MIFMKETQYHVVPYKHLVKKVNLPNGASPCVPIWVMEMTLFEAYNEFIKEYPNVKVQRRAFEMKRPKNVRTMKDAKRLVCAFTYHVSIDHVRKSLNNLLLINNKPLIKVNPDLVDRALCSSDKIACIAGMCKYCKNFKKLNELNIDKLRCSKKCVADNEDCSAQNHTLEVSLFERTEYLHKGKTKKKLQLVDKVLTPAKFVDLFKIHS